MKPFLKIAGLLLLLLSITLPCSALISVGELSKKEAAELGITMKRRGNGDAGELVWIEFKKEAFLEKLTYCELHLRDAKGKQLASARLEPHPVVHPQPKDLVSFLVLRGPVATGELLVLHRRLRQQPRGRGV